MQALVGREVFDLHVKLARQPRGLVDAVADQPPGFDLLQQQQINTARAHLLFDLLQVGVEIQAVAAVQVQRGDAQVVGAARRACHNRAGQ